jgi:hypothetical protein
MACDNCRGEHPDGSCDTGAGLLMGFLSDFRSARDAPGTDSVPIPSNPAVTVTSPSESPPVPVSSADGASAGAFKEHPPVAPHPRSVGEHRSSDQPPSTSDRPLLYQPSGAPGYPTYPPPSPHSRPVDYPPPPGYPTSPGYSPPTGYPPPPGFTGYGYPPAGGRRTPRRLLIGAVIGAAVVAAAAAVGVIVVRHRDGPPFPAAWDPRVAPIAQFVQNQRGLTWKHPVKVEFLPLSQFQAVIKKEDGPAADTPRDQQFLDALRAVGVVSGTVDLNRAAQQFEETDVIGLYVDTDKTVYVRGDQLTPDVRTTLAHELTHALQDQYFNLQKLKSGNADDDSAVTALIEGDAVRVQSAYENSLSPGDQELYVQEQTNTAGSADSQNAQDGIPPFLIDQSSFPYDFGPTFVASLFSAGGNAEVDQAFRDPPTRDGEIIDPESFVPGGSEPTVAAPALPKGAQVLHPSGGFGEMTLLEMLGDQLGFEAADRAVQGWVQDAAVIYRQAGTVCVDVTVLNQSPADATVLEQAGSAWAKHLPAASATQSGATVHFQTCDPGPAWKPAAITGDPYQDLAAHSVLLFQLLTDGHLGAGPATCAADNVVATMGSGNLYQALQIDDPNSPSARQLESSVASAVRACA